MKDWKACERRVAEILGGVRVPVTGRQRGVAPDIEHETLSIEVKSRKSLPEWLLAGCTVLILSDMRRTAEIWVVDSPTCRVMPKQHVRELMNLWLLKPGHKIRTRDGAEAEILSETEDGQWIKIRYLDGDASSSGGTEDLVNENEVEVLLGVARTEGWSETVTVILHHFPESEESEEGYEALTMTGVPYDVSITGSDSDSAEGALNHLLGGLRAFGFSGLVNVEDVTEIGRVERYAVDVLR